MNQPYLFNDRMSRGRPPRYLWWTLILAAILGADASRAPAQNLNNRGKIVNIGSFTVRKAVNGLPDTVGGTFGFSGTDQSIPARTYLHLNLAGSGEKLSTGSILVTGTVAVAAPVTLKMPAGSTLELGTLNGRLTELGYVSGHVKKAENLTASGSLSVQGIRTPSGPIGGNLAASGSSDMGGIGVTISWETTAPGLTSVDRYSGPSASITVGGKRSIQRYYDIVAAVDTGVNATVTLSYAPDEVTGLDQGSLELWRSPDQGATWRRQRTLHTASARTLARSGIRSFGRFTAADGTNPLGIPKYEWEADTLRLIAGNDQKKPNSQFLDSLFVVRVTDAFNQPVPGAVVTFTVTGRPNGSAGDSLTVVSAASDREGKVSSRFKLGNMAGQYEVTAQVAGTAGAVFKFRAEARSRTLLPQVFAGNGQQDSVRSTLADFQVMVRDENSLAVKGVPLTFAIVSQPQHAAGAFLSKATDTTDATGLASTRLHLGSKAGEYVVEVTSTEFDQSRKQTFRVTAVAGRPQIAWVQQSTQADTIGATVAALGFGVTDRDTNAVVNSLVNFRVAARPADAAGDSLYQPSAATDSTGFAWTQVRLGDKVGAYTIEASLASQTGLSGLSTVRALHGRPMRLAASTTTTPADTIGSTLSQYVSSVVDRGNNPVPNVSVRFAVTSSPSNAAGTILSNSSAISDSAGAVATRLQLGDKVGLYRVTASADTIPGVAVDFLAQATHGVPATLDTASYRFESKPILEPLDSAFVVRLADRGNNPIAGEQVRFSVIPVHGSSGHAVSDTSVVTDADGRAKTRLTVGSKTGIYTVVAAAPKLQGLSRSFAARALPGAAQTLAGLTADQSKPVFETADAPLTVSVKDKGGNPVAGSMVVYTLRGMPAGSDSTRLTVDTAYTGADGLASAFLKVGSKVGLYTVMAKHPSLPRDSALFTVRAVHGVAALLASESVPGDTAEVGQRLRQFTINVFDRGLNPVPNEVVQFVVSAVPDGASGHFLSAVTDTTDSLGRVSTRLTLGDRPGTYRVEAVYGLLARASFNAIATFTLGDPNSSGQIDIADLTQLIDHNLGVVRMSGVDSARADFNRDGAVNIQDIVILRNRLLTNRWFAAASPQSSVTASEASIAALAKDAGERTSNDQDSQSGASDTTVVASTTFGWMEATAAGIRFNMKNDLPVKGVELVMKLKYPISVSSPDVVFPRANNMSVLVNSTRDTIRAVMYNLGNTPIAPDSGVLFRLNVKLRDTSDLEWARIIISTGNNVATYLPSEHVAKVVPSLPQEWVLHQNYPNPFNPYTTIAYEVPEIGGRIPRIAIQIFNILGEKVKTIERTHKDAGRYSVTWDGTNDAGQRVATGVYIYRLLSPDKQMSKKMIMLK